MDHSLERIRNDPLCEQDQEQAVETCRSHGGAVASAYHTRRFTLVPRLKKALRVPTPANRGPCTRIRVRPKFEEALKTAREIKAHAPPCRVIFTVYEMGARNGFLASSSADGGIGERTR